jgi:hypothetical protein
MKNLKVVRPKEENTPKKKNYTFLLNIKEN